MNVFFSGRNTKAQCASTEVATGTPQCCHFEHVLFCIPHEEWFCQRRQRLLFVQEGCKAIAMYRTCEGCYLTASLENTRRNRYRGGTH